MKALKFILAAALVLALCLGLMPVAFAESGEKIPYGELEWDELMERLLAAYNIKREFIAAGYLNLETGEEHYINGDDYMLTGSMYKVPLCMYFTEHLAAGDIDWSPYESHFTFEEKRDNVLINSSNDDAMFLSNMIGGYTEFRRLTADYMGVDPDEELAHINNYQNWYTAREFIHCLELLYREQERFPGIIETMQKATPNRFFKLNEPRFKIAHKYGEWKDDINGGPTCLNDCGLAFTKQPIAMVLFTRGQSSAEEFISDFATAMCEYTEARVIPPQVPEVTPVAELVPVVTAVPASAADAAVIRTDNTSLLLPVAFVGLFLLLGLIAILVLCAKYKLRFFSLFLALVVSAAAMLLAAAGTQLGTLYAKPSGDPQATVSTFFDALCAGNYDEAYTQLRDYADLGLAVPPSTPAGQKVYEALHKSFSYELEGDCTTDMLDAKQSVRMTYLNLPAMEGDVESETKRQIEDIVNSRSISEVYDENKRYRPEVTEEAYLAALDTVLAHAEDYYTQESFTLDLTYTDGRWQLLTSPALLRALNGGTTA